MSIYADIAARSARDLVRLRSQHAVVAEPSIIHGTSTCEQCGGIVFPTPNGMQKCQQCQPTKEVGDKAERDTDSTRKTFARSVGARTYKSVEPCKPCRDNEPVRYVVGDRCVVCIAAAYADDDNDVPVAAPMRENLQHAPPTSHTWRKTMVPKPVMEKPPKPVVVKPPKPPKPVVVKPPKPPKKYQPNQWSQHHPLADANRARAIESGANTYDATDRPCIKCGCTDRYVSDHCVPCRAVQNRERYLRKHAAA